MSRIRRGGFVFLTWAGDHVPRHVHVYRDRRLVLKWDLENGKVMTGFADQHVLALIRELEREGRL